MKLATSATNGKRSFFEGVIATFLLGVPGIVAVGVSSIGQLRQIFELADLPATALFLVAVTQPLALLAVACLVGTALASRVKLHSHLLARITGRVQPPALFAEELPIAVAVGVAAGLATLALDFAFAPFLPDELSLVVAVNANDASAFDVLASIPVRFLYGGVTEELVMRYGLLTLVAWGLWKFTDGRRPSNRVMWTAIVVSAVVFAFGHLPAVSMRVSLTPVVVARTLLLNWIVGVGFGWLYWRQSLESAMVGHVSFHVAVVAVSLVLVL